jgi:hypothetical protein
MANEKAILTIVKEYGEEIDALLRTIDPKYEVRVYIKPARWMEDLTYHPERYPKLSKLATNVVKRFISNFLEYHGRIRRHEDRKYPKATIWMLPDAAGMQG